MEERQILLTRQLTSSRQKVLRSSLRAQPILMSHRLPRVLASQLLGLHCQLRIQLSEIKRQTPCPVAQTRRRNRRARLLLQPLMLRQLGTLSHLLSLLAHPRRSSTASRCGTTAVYLACTDVALATGSANPDPSAHMLGQIAAASAIMARQYYLLLQGKLMLLQIFSTHLLAN